MTLMALVVAVTAGAQGRPFMNIRGTLTGTMTTFVELLMISLDFLSAFGGEFGNPPEPCDYDGTFILRSGYLE